MSFLFIPCGMQFPHGCNVTKLRVIALALKGGFSGMPEFGLCRSGLVFLIK